MLPARCRPGDGRGAVLVEFALVLPLFLALALGIFTGGNAYSRHITVVEAVREGARYGASLPLGTGATAMATWEDSVRSRVISAANGDLALSDVCVKLVLPAGGSDCGVPDPAGAAVELSVHVVKVSAQTTATIELFFFKVDRTLGGRQAARYERDTG